MGSSFDSIKELMTHIESLHEIISSLRLLGAKKSPKASLKRRRMLLLMVLILYFHSCMFVMNATR